MVGSESARLTTNRRSDFMKASAPLDLSKLGSANDQGLRRKGGEKSQVKQLELCGASSSILTTMSKSCLHSKSVIPWHCCQPLGLQQEIFEAVPDHKSASRKSSDRMPAKVGVGARYRPFASSKSGRHRRLIVNNRQGA